MYNERYYWIESLPYRVGITVAFICLIMGYAMVFNKTVAYYYGTMVAGEDLPEGVESVSELTVNQVAPLAIPPTPPPPPAPIPQPPRTRSDSPLFGLGTILTRHLRHSQAHTTLYPLVIES